MRIVFMGTPDFAAAHLRTLVSKGHEVVLAISQPDKPKGRKKIMTPPPVADVARELNLPLSQPQTLKNGAIKELLEVYSPELIVVVAYGKILPEYVLDFPKYGCINVHGSLLPEYRGAAPIQRAIIDGKKVTGITIMYLDKGLDTGDMILKRECEIAENDNQETLFSKLTPIGCEAMLSAIELIKNGEAKREAQDGEKSTYAEMLSPTTGEIDWTADAGRVHDLVRGTYPWPCAYSHFDGQKFKILKSERTMGKGEPGKIIASGAEGLTVACGTGAIKILSVQFEGGKKMDIKDYLRGHEMPIGKILD